jgi:hypothetical protein
MVNTDKIYLLGNAIVQYTGKYAVPPSLANKIVNTSPSTKYEMAYIDPIFEGKTVWCLESELLVAKKDA